MLIPDSLLADSADSLYKKALELEKSGQKDFAVFRYLSITRNYPNSKRADDAFFKLGEYYYQNYDYFNAKRSFEDLLHKHPRSPFIDKSKQYLKSILDLYETSKTESEINKLISDIEILKTKKNWDDIIAECAKIENFSPLPSKYEDRLIEYYKLCGDEYLKTDELQKAKEAYEKIIKIAPGDREILNKLYEINKLLE